MKKIQIDIPVVLPAVQDEKDQCIQRLMTGLKAINGISRVHIKSENSAEICIHYDPSIISINKILNTAQKNGAELTGRYIHEIIEVKGIRHSRHARRLEKTLKRISGVVEISVSSGGIIRVEFDKESGDLESIKTILNKEGLVILKKNDAGKFGQSKDVKPFLGTNTELYFALGSGIFWGIGVILSFIGGTSEYVQIGIFTVSIFLGAYFTVIEAVRAISKLKFEIDFLMLVAAAGAVALGKWGEAALLLFLFSLGHALEHFAMNRAKKSIAALHDLTPHTAIVLKEGQQAEIPIEDLKVGDIVFVKPNSTIPGDGVIIQGQGVVNQAPITGESIPVAKIASVDPDTSNDLSKILPENRVFAGTINGPKALHVKVLSASKDSTLSRLINLVKEAESQKSQTQHFTDKIEKYYVPGVLVVITCLLFAFLILDESFGQSFYRAMAVLVAASPCALAISTPSAVLAGVARAARQGVLVKGGRPLEDLGEIHAIAFDKTGTLTEGRPTLTEIIPYDNVTKEELLQISIAVESLSDHPLAKAIAEGGRRQLIDKNIPKAKDVEALIARGVKATVNDGLVYIGNRRLFKELAEQALPEALESQMTRLEELGNTVMIVYFKEQYLGVIAVMDVPREEAAPTLKTLAGMGISRMIMLTGDHQEVANAIAAQIGITDPLGGLLPEDKVQAIDKLLMEEGKVAMVGDGVNDAPAMAKSTVGIAMGAAGSAVALETADVALLADKLDNLPFAIALGRKAKRIISQNLLISLGMVIILVPLTLFGIAEIGPAVIGHEGSTLIVVLNALRLLSFKMETAVQHVP